MTDTDNSGTYQEEFKKAFLDWATQNPDPALIEDMPEHLQAYKDLLPMANIRDAIRELDPINETIANFQGVAHAQQITSGEFKLPHHAVKMVSDALKEIEEDGGIDLPDHIRELEERSVQDDDQSPDMEP